jgi:hypothetical protein
VPYFHVVFTLPGPIADIACQNKAVIYDLLFKAAAEATLTIASDPKHLGARIGHLLLQSSSFPKRAAAEWSGTRKQATCGVAASRCDLFETCGKIAKMGQPTAPIGDCLRVSP